MKVAIIGSRGIRSGYSGIERVLAQLCPRIAALGHEVHVFGEHGEDPSDPSPPGVRSIRVPSFPGKYTETITRSALATAVAMARRYDVINLVAIGPGIMSAAGRLAGLPTVVSIHGLDWRRDKWPAPARLALRGAERTIVACADEITCVSRELVTHFARAHSREVAYAPNGVDVVPGPADPAALASMGLEQDGYALFASRLVPEKGAHDLVRAFAGVPPGKRLVIAGGGRYDMAYVDSLKAAAAPLGDRVVFTGHLEGARLDAAFRGACLYVLPSYMEGLSLSLLEAMGHGKPCLVSDIPENVEAAGDTGATFAPGDVAALTDGISRLLASPGEAAALGTRAAERARQHFSWDGVARRYVDVYERVARPRGARAAAGNAR